MLKFYYNGIKDNGGKLQTCFYSDGITFGYPVGTITIYAREYKSFSDGVRAEFEVKNDSDGRTDYFETDRIYVLPNHPLYQQVRGAMIKAKAKMEIKKSRKVREETNASS